MVENKRYTVSIHYRRVVTRNVGRVKSVVKAEMKHSQFRNLTLTEGKKVIEIRPAVKWNKGEAVKKVLRMMPEQSDQRRVLFYFGDDRTDEDAFKIIGQNGYGIQVGKHQRKKTWARHNLAGPNSVHRILRMIVRSGRELASD